MKKENRLKKRKQFNWIFKNGEKVSTSLITLVYSTTKNKDYKVGFSVSKKIGKAVTRNKTKRRMKEAVLKFSSNIVGKHCYIFVAKQGIEDASFEEIVKNTEQLLKKANLFTENV